MSDGDRVILRASELPPGTIMLVGSSKEGRELGVMVKTEHEASIVETLRNLKRALDHADKYDIQPFTG